MMIHPLKGILTAICTGFLGLLLASCAAGPAPETAPVPEVIPVDNKVPQEAPVAPLLTVEQLLGLSPSTVEGILGVPAFKREDRGVEVWQYVSPDCVAHIYLYVDPALQAYKVNHVATHGRDLSASNPTVSANACLSGLLPHSDKGAALKGKSRSAS